MASIQTHQPSVPSPATLMRIKSVLEGSYTDAVKAHLEYEVFAGVRNKKAIQEFEAALAHLAQATLHDDASQIDHMESHCQRVAIETTEFVLESYLDSIRERLDPYYKHPRIAKLLLLTKPAFLDAYYSELRGILDLVSEGRQQKGNPATYQHSLSAFKEALVLAKKLDKKAPLCAFSERTFAVLLTIVSLILGGLIGAYVDHLMK